MSCSVGRGEGCSGEVFVKSDISSDDWYLLKVRSGAKKLKRICKTHRLAYLTFYEKRQRYCCDPFKKHATSASGDLREICKEMHLKSVASPVMGGAGHFILVPGKKLCRRCYSQVIKHLKLVQEWDEDPAYSSGSTSPDEAPQTNDSGDPSVEVNKTGETTGQLATDTSCTDVDSLQKCPTCHAKLSGPLPTESLLLPTNPDVMRLREQHSRIQSDEDKETYNTQTQTSADGDQNSESSGSLYHPDPKSDRAVTKLNAAMKEIDESPVNKRKLSSSGNYVPTKLKKIEEQCAALMVTAGASNLEVDNTFETDVMNALLTKFQNSVNVSDKILVLSVALSALPQRKVLELFGPHGATNYLIRKTASLMSEQGLFPTPLPKKGRSLPEGTIKLVETFYNSDKVTYQLPGKKDCIIVRVNGEKVPIPKKLILCALRELHSMFLEEFPEVTVSFSKFASLRPKHCVLAGSAGTHSVCVCRYHQNFKLMVEGGNFNHFNYKYQRYSNFINAVICEKPTSDCYLQSCCPKCPGFDVLKDSLLDLYSENFVEEITFNNWSDKERSLLETIVKSTDEFVDTFIQSLKELLPHHYIANKQAEYLDNMKKNLKEGEVLVISDFSENYSFLIQDSVQSFYWSNDQATVHPFAAYYMEDGVLKFTGYVVVSDCLKHGVHAFYAFQKKFIAFIKTVVRDVRKIIYFSDGAAQQYKNMYNMINQTYHLQDFYISSEWHYFASSHGKGPSDGLGGAFKCSASRASTQNTLIRTPKELYEWGVARKNSSINLGFVSIQEVDEVTSFLKTRFDKALAIKGMRSLHCCIPTSVGELSVRRFSYSDKSYFRAAEYKRKVPDWSDLEPGEFITALYKKSWLLAMISNKDPEAGDLLVVFLLRHQHPGPKKTFFYTMPDLEEDVPISVNDVFAVVRPIFDVSCQRYTLSDNDIERTSWQSKSASKI